MTEAYRGRPRAVDAGLREMKLKQTGTLPAGEHSQGEKALCGLLCEAVNSLTEGDL